MPQRIVIIDNSGSLSSKSVQSAIVADATAREAPSTQVRVVTSTDRATSETVWSGTVANLPTILDEQLYMALDMICASVIEHTATGMVPVIYTDAWSVQTDELIALLHGVPHDLVVILQSPDDDVRAARLFHGLIQRTIDCRHA